MAAVPRRLLVFPRPDLAPAGVEVLELQLRAHDGERLRAVLGRSAFAGPGIGGQLRHLSPEEPEELDWDAIGDGHVDLLYQPPARRRLEDRVLDVLRLCGGASTLGVDLERLHFREELSPRADALRIAACLIDREDFLRDAGGTLC